MLVIKCMAGKGLMDKEECLTCARESIAPPCGWNEALLRAVYASQEEERLEVHVTDLVGCPRKVIFEKQDRVIDAGAMIPAFVGKCIHAYVEKFASSGEVPVGTEDIVGRIDTIRDGVIFELKTTAWILKDAPLQAHVDQVQTYMHLLGVEEAIITYMATTGAIRCGRCKTRYRLVEGAWVCPGCGNTNENAHNGARSFRIKRDASHKPLIKMRTEYLAMYMESGEEPEAEPGPLCKFCAHPTCEERE